MATGFWMMYCKVCQRRKPGRPPCLSALPPAIPVAPRRERSRSVLLSLFLVSIVLGKYYYYALKPRFTAYNAKSGSKKTGAEAPVFHTRWDLGGTHTRGADPLACRGISRLPPHPIESRISSQICTRANLHLHPHHPRRGMLRNRIALLIGFQQIGPPIWFCS